MDTTLLQYLEEIHCLHQKVQGHLAGASTLVEKARALAISAHALQRYGDRPYVLHLQEVADIVLEFQDERPEGTSLEVLLAAAWLHDSIEDAGLSYNDIVLVSDLSTATREVADIVFALTTSKGRNRKERADARYYARIREIPGAVFLKLCDRLANVRFSKATGSRMWGLYKKEMPGFLGSLLHPVNPPRLVDELNQV